MSFFISILCVDLCVLHYLQQIFLKATLHIQKVKQKVLLNGKLFEPYCIPNLRTSFLINCVFNLIFYCKMLNITRSLKWFKGSNITLKFVLPKLFPLMFN